MEGTLRRKHLFKAIGLAAVISLLAVVPSVGVGAADGDGDGGFDRFVPEALPPEGLESVLFDLEGTFLERGIGEARKFGEVAGVNIRTGNAQVEVFPAADTAAAEAAVAAHGGRVIFGGRAYPMLVALMPLGRLADLAADPAVAMVQAPAQPFTEAVTGEGIAASGADAWHTKGYQGQGVQVAILDSGFRYYTDAQASGDLPANLTTKNYCSTDLDDSSRTLHGTAVAEIVHEMAPMADLYLICSDSTDDIASALNYMGNRGIDVFNHSVGYFNTGRGDGTGTFKTLGAKAFRKDVVWVNSAGNYAQNHWRGNFADAGLPGDPDGIHNFSTGDEGNTFTLAAGKTVNVILKWDDWPTTSHNFDLVLYEGTTVWAFSNTVQNGSQPPTERLSYTNTTGSTKTLNVVIQHTPGPPGPVVDFDLFVLGPGDLQHKAVTRSLNDPSTVKTIMATAAVNHADNTIEYYSSQGPTIDARVEPDISGYARVSNLMYGNYPAGGFYGTSAAAPHVTGAAVLARQAWPELTAGQVRGRLQRRATDAGAAGRDSAYGEGLLTLGTPPNIPKCDGKKVTIWGSGDADIITGTSGADVIMGFGGADQIDGGGGNDRICAGPGDDIVDGGNGNDRIFGEDGDDFITGGNGDDKAWGGAGNDQIDGEDGNDLSKGEDGDDYLIAGTGGSDSFDGGTGKDQIDYSQAPNGVTIDLDAGTAGDRAINDTIIRVENAVGSQFDDRILGNAKGNRLFGQDGDDTILGRDGKDRLYGSAGGDTLKGEAGNDFIKGESGNDTLWGGGGTDILVGGAGKKDVCRQGETNKPTCETIL